MRIVSPTGRPAALRGLAVVCALAALAAACGTDSDGTDPASADGREANAAAAGAAATDASAGGCSADLAPTPLPDWATAGFTGAEPGVPFVLGTGGQIGAILFGTLTSPPSGGRTDKILWVPREPAPPGPMTITARLGANDTRPVVQTLPNGPGPSTVALPEPGCWTLELDWTGHSDTVELGYGPG